VKYDLYLNAKISGDVKEWFNGIGIWTGSGSRYHSANPDRLLDIPRIVH